MDASIPRGDFVWNSTGFESREFESREFESHEYEYRGFLSGEYGMNYNVEVEMPSSKSCVYIHYVWATHLRYPYMNEEIRLHIYESIAHSCNDMECHLVEIGGTEDHVHVLVRINPTATIANLAKRMKGASSHLITHVLHPNSNFKWQESYAAFSVDYHHHEELISYIKNQRQHHAAGNFRSEWEYEDDE